LNGLSSQAAKASPPGRPPDRISAHSTPRRDDVIPLRLWREDRSAAVAQLIAAMTEELSNDDNPMTLVLRPVVTFNSPLC
jgi:hypothetical protein